MILGDANPNTGCQWLRQCFLDDDATQLPTGKASATQIMVDTAIGTRRPSSSSPLNSPHNELWERNDDTLRCLHSSKRRSRNRQFTNTAFERWIVIFFRFSDCDRRLKTFMSLSSFKRPCRSRSNQEREAHVQSISRGVRSPRERCVSVQAKDMLSVRLEIFLPSSQEAMSPPGKCRPSSIRWRCKRPTADRRTTRSHTRLSVRKRHRRHSPTTRRPRIGMALWRRIRATLTAGSF